jgi:hypothetical protein
MTPLYSALAAAAIFALSPAGHAQTPPGEGPAETAPSTAAPTPDTAAAPAAATAPSGSIRIPAGMAVEMEFVEAVGSATSHPGDTFALRLAAPIVIDGRVIVPAGAPGGGEVIDAQASRFGGQQGKLVISGRFLDVNGQRVRIRGMTITGAGRSNVGMVAGLAWVPYAGLGSIFIHGREIEIPAGALASAKLAVDVDVPETSLAPPTPPASAE